MMLRFRRFLTACVVPAAVFQSVNIGGGYGTGRELVEYFTQYGPLGGLMGLALAFALLSVAVSVTYEYARRFQAFDYRTFFRSLIGRFWPAFEALYILMFVLAVSVALAGASAVVQSAFGLPGYAGAAAMTVAVCALIFFGARILALAMTWWSLALYAALALFMVVMLTKFNAPIAETLKQGAVNPGWARSALQYALYSSVAVPAVLFAVKPLETATESVAAGILSALLFITPAAAFHFAFLAGYPAITAEALPVYAMLEAAALPALTLIYTIVLFGTLIETGAGVIQGMIARVDAALVEKRGAPASRRLHFLVAALGFAVAIALSQFGVIALIAKGYGLLAWGFLGVYIAPLLTVGVWRLMATNKQEAAAGARP